METVSIDIVIGQLLDVLREAFEGPRDRWSYFTDTSADAGLFGTLKALSPEDASRALGGTSVDEAEWRRLLERLRVGYADLRRAF